jgi:hypothetical protein
VQEFIIQVSNCCGTLQFEQTMVVKVFYINSVTLNYQPWELTDAAG